MQVPAGFRSRVNRLLANAAYIAAGTFIGAYARQYKAHVVKYIKTVKTAIRIAPRSTAVTAISIIRLTGKKLIVSQIHL